MENMETLPEKTEKSTPPAVAIDGTKIKNIREAKKLTQLYVSSVVGVTTDTISRWENNRYPSIKRDNAEKLAGALEVALAEILKNEEATAAAPEQSKPPRKTGRRVIMVIIAVLLIAGATGIFLFRQLTPPLAAERKLPRFGAPGEILPVQIKISRKKTAPEGFIVKERLPAGWRLVASLPPAAIGHGDVEEIKWLIPGGVGHVTVSYTVRIGGAAPLKTEAHFSGSIVAHTDGFIRTENIGGDHLVTVAGVHWADANGDGRIDDNEIIPAYYLTEAMKGLDLDWKTIEAIWSGKGYRWDAQTQKFVVIR